MKQLTTEADNKLTLRMPLTYAWFPQPDITTYELAQCLSVIFVNDYYIKEQLYQLLTPECKRHWKESKRS